MQNRVVKYVQLNDSPQEQRTYYIRDAQGNVMATYTGYVTVEEERTTWDSLRLSEQHIYGSSRVGMELPNLQLYPAVPENPNMVDTGRYAIFEGRKRYEISNHLGNVLSVITDRKRGAAASGSQIQWFEADVVSAQQYYPFGMLMPGSTTDSLRRQYTLGNNDYRYGFNGKEGDDEVKGDDNQQDYGMRIYDPRVGRFLSVDPLAGAFSWQSPYCGLDNNPVRMSDPSGMHTEDDIFLDENGNEMFRVKNRMSDRYFLQNKEGDYEFFYKKYVQVNSPNTLRGDIKDGMRHKSMSGNFLLYNLII
jgi:RHS repeat-associated protein